MEIYEKIKVFVGVNAWKNKGENGWKSMKRIKEFGDENAWNIKGKSG